MSGDGGPAFPVQPLGSDGLPTMEAATGMSKRDYFAAHSPITFDVALRGWGGDLKLGDDESRGIFFAVWALLCREWADALLAELARERDDG